MQNKIPHILTINSTYNSYAATNPFHATLENEGEAVVKYLNNNEGNLSLINEYVSYLIANRINVRIPNFGLCIFDENTQNNTNVSFCEKNYGIAFYTSFIKRATPVMSWSPQFIKNKENFVNTLVLDHIIYNKDRHPGNYIVSQGGILFAIDHSHVFKNQCVWNKYTFIQGMENNDYRDKDILEENSETYNYFFASLHLIRSDFYDVCNRVKKELKPTLIHEILSKIPDSWKNETINEDISYLEKYINYRVKHIDDIVDLICEERGIE